nr:unnamed protein product [Callosobruchus chinensis]
MDQSQDTPTNFNFSKPTVATTSSFEFMRKFLEESTKWKKKGEDKKKKKKKEKKSKKDSKKKKKKDKLKRSKNVFELGDLDDHKKLRDAIKKELNKDKKSKRHSIPSDEEEYFLQKSGFSKRFIESLPDLEELESKLNAYYALEKDKRSASPLSSPRRGGAVTDSPSPTREQKARQAVAEAAASAKWKMHIGAAQPSASRFKRKSALGGSGQPPPPGTSPPGAGQPSSHDWLGEQEKRKSSSYDSPPPTKKGSLPPLPPTEKAVSVRKVMAMKEPPLPPAHKKGNASSESPPLPPSKKSSKPSPAPTAPKIPQGQVVLDKFGNFRLMTPPELKKAGSSEAPPLPPGRRPPEPPGRPRSESRSPKRRSRSRSKYSNRSSSSGSRSRSRSYRSRSRSYYSRSRSRSGSYYSRSRSRSRSYSGDRRRYRRGGGRYNDRGTYYKPRFQTPRHNDRGRGGGYYRGRDRYDRDFRGRGRGHGPFRGGRRPRGRYSRGGYRDYRDRRFDRSRSRDRDRSRSYSGSRERDSVSPRRSARRSSEKEKINKYSGDGQPEVVRHEGPLSEGEDRDDYNTGNDSKLIDRDAFAGKWADKEESGTNENGSADSKAIPPETNLEEMDKFLNKAKKDKKEEMLERNKDILKTKA